jgi:hypothetical protein
MNLGNLIDFCGNLLDYDPVNPTYREQLVALLNDSQTRLLTDRHWSFAQKERDLRVYTDMVFDVALTGASSTAVGVFPFSTDPLRPGSRFELAEMEIDVAGVTRTYEIRYINSGTEAILDRAFIGPTATYRATFKWREVYLPADSTNVMNVSDPSVGVPRKSAFLSKFERDEVDLDPDLLGTVEAYLPSESRNIPAPRLPRGVTVTGSAPGQGNRTINVYMVNVMGPRSQNYSLYRPELSAGFESALSKVGSYQVNDTQTLQFTPEALGKETGLYRRYYFTCEEAGILAPVRIRNADDEGALPAIDTDTVPPQGGLTLAPDLSLNTLQGQPFQSVSVRYQFNQSAAYRAIQLYPHPSADQDLRVRVLTAPVKMQEDQDSPLIPSAYSQVVAYAALEQLTLKVDNPALSQVYERKKVTLIRGMEAKYLGEVPRRIIKGTPTAGHRFLTNPFGPLTFTP